MKPDSRNESDAGHDAYLEQLRTIHGLREGLGLTDGEYRRLLGRLTGSRSAKYMTSAQRRRVIAFLGVYSALETALAELEEARDTLNREVEALQDRHHPKIVVLDGSRKVTMMASIEEVIATVRSVHGADVRLAGVREVQLPAGPALELSFERPTLHLLAG